MSEKNLNALNATDDGYIIVRYKKCNKFLTEISVDATGRLRQKCVKCKLINKISLPLRMNLNNIATGQNASTT